MDLQQKQACWELELDSSWVSKFDPSKKKKKKKKSRPPIHEGGIFFQKGEDNAPPFQSGRRLLPGHNFEPDYGYKELLSRAFYMLREDDLEISTERSRTVMMLPRLLAEGTQRTVCLNFTDLCRTLHRKPDHVMKFLLGQMKTEGLLNKQQRLEMKGLVTSKDFQAMFWRYIDVFIICSCCKSPDTALVEDNSRFTLRCEMCGLVAFIRETKSPVKIL